MRSRVLVVDDSSTIRKVVGAVLTRAGYDVAHAADGAQAFEALQRDHFDLALIDFVMPKLNGFELCKKLREDAALRTMPVVLMSAKADRIRDHFLRQTGALDALTKPFDPRALLLAVEAVLSKRGRGDAIEVTANPTPSGPDRPDSAPPSSAFGATDEMPRASGDLRELTLQEARGAPLNARPIVPDAFVRKLAQAYARIGEGPNDSAREKARDVAAIEASLRRVLGEDGISSLFTDLAGPAATAGLSGAIDAIPLAEVLQLLQLQQQTGLLSVTDGREGREGRAEVQIAMRDGFVDLATSRGAADEFRLGRYLLEAGLLTRPTLDALLAAERASKRPRLLGDALIAERVLTAEQLRGALTRQTCELIYDVLRWTRGRFVFEQRATRIEAMAAQLGLPLASIVMEGYRRVDEWRQMEGLLGDFDQVFHRDVAAIDALALRSGEVTEANGGAAGGLAREERIVLAAIDGTRSVREVVGAVSMSSFDVCKILFRLAEARLVRKRVA